MILLQSDIFFVCVCVFGVQQKHLEVKSWTFKSGNSDSHLSLNLSLVPDCGDRCIEVYGRNTLKPNISRSDEETPPENKKTTPQRVD